MIERKEIYSYTTQQAVDDGVLVEVPSEILKEIGIRYPVFLTEIVHRRYVEVPADAIDHQDYSARLFDLLYMFWLSAKSQPHDVLFYFFTCLLCKDSTALANEKISELSRYHKEVKLKSVLEPYEKGGAKITILLPSED
jgi:hypothetical protein